MKRLLVFAALLCLLSGTALGEALSGPVLLVELPADAQMIEDVEFDNGDFVQTYQLSAGAHITLLRSLEMDMTLSDLLESEWPEAEGTVGLQVSPISGYPTQAVAFSSPDVSGTRLSVTLLTVQSGPYSLVFEAVYPEFLGQDQIQASVSRMLQSMNVLQGDLEVLG